MADIFQIEVECPNCKNRFSIEEVISDKVRSDFESKIKHKVEEEITKAKEKEFERINLEHQLEIENLKKEFQQSQKKELEASQETISILKQQLLEFQKELEERKQELDFARKVELEFRRKENELIQKEQNLELELQRRLSEERKQIQEFVKNSLHSEYELKIREKEETISSMQKKIEELNLKLQMGSQQLQGEVQEIVIEEQLKMKFPIDKIEPVPKGIRGADIIQEVRNRFGEVCGKILWESKRTNNWSNEWIPKLKEDQREIGAEFCAIVSRALPKEINSVGLLDGVWVCDFNSYIGLAMALRENLIQVNNVKNSLIGRETKMEQIFNYICSEQFSQKVRAIVEAFVAMKNDLDKEKAAMEKHWKKREEELNKVLKNTTRIYGEIEALVGNQLPEIEYLKLPGS